MKTANYHRRGWNPVRLHVLKHDKEVATVDLGDKEGNPVVTNLPVLEKVPEAGPDSFAVLEPDPAAEEEAAKKAAEEEAAKKAAEEEAAKKTKPKG